MFLPEELAIFLAFKCDNTPCEGLSFLSPVFQVTITESSGSSSGTQGTPNFQWHGRIIISFVGIQGLLILMVLLIDHLNSFAFVDNLFQRICF